MVVRGICDYGVPYQGRLRIGDRNLPRAEQAEITDGELILRKPATDVLIGRLKNPLRFQSSVPKPIAGVLAVYV